MIDALPLFHRIAGCPVILLGDGEAAQAKRRLIERAGGLVCGAECPLARLAFVATDAPEQAAAALRARGVLVNVVDRPDLCDFTTPAIVDRNPVLIAVGTGGASAGLAKQVRLRIEALLPEGLGALARGLFGARAALRARFPDAGVRRRALDEALGAGGALDPFDPASAQRVGPWLDGAQEGVGSGVVEITLRSDDPEDLTLREARLLGSADGIVVGAGVGEAVLARARADAMRCSTQEFQSFTKPAGLWIVLHGKFG